MLLGEKQVSPLRFAPVEMTPYEAFPPGVVRVGGHQIPFLNRSVYEPMRLSLDAFVTGCVCEPIRGGKVA